jgi:twitching motility protein PilT
VGDLADAAVLDTALKAAETGHLVISALDTPDVLTTIHRLITMMPLEEQDATRARLSQALRAIVSQRLLPRADGHGRAAAVEVLIATGDVPDMIRDAERTEHLMVYVATSRAQFGMQTFDQHLVDLALAGTVTPEAAVAAATNRAEVETQTSGLKRRLAPQVATLSQIFPPQ